MPLLEDNSAGSIVSTTEGLVLLEPIGTIALCKAIQGINSGWAELTGFSYSSRVSRRHHGSVLPSVRWPVRFAPRPVDRLVGNVATRGRNIYR